MDGAKKRNPQNAIRVKHVGYRIAPNGRYPSLAFVGGPDVDSRLELMQALRDDFKCIAIGSSPTLCNRFSEAEFQYRWYTLDRRTNPLRDLVTLIQLWHIFSQLRPQIVHTFDTKPGVWGRLAARLAGVPTIVGTLPGLGTLYTQDRHSIHFVRAIYEPLQKLACNVSDVTIFQNQEDASQFVAARIVPASKVVVVHGSGVSTNRFNPSMISENERKQTKKALGILPNSLVVTMISRVIRSKGVLEFAEAARSVRQIHPSSSFLLIGPTDEESTDRLTLQERVELAKCVIWPGARNDIPAILAATDVFVLPSFYREGIPRVLLEAAAMELPIVTTNSPGCRQVVEAGINGFLVSPRQSDTLVESILQLLANPELRKSFGYESRRRAKTHFDLAVIAEQMRSTYLMLLNDKGLLPKGEIP